MEKIKEFFTLRRSIGLVLILAGVCFAFQNLETVKISFLVLQISTPLVFLILILLALGFLGGWLFANRKK